MMVGVNVFEKIAIKCYTGGILQGVASDNGWERWNLSEL